MNWDKILQINGFKVLVILILLLYPFVSYTAHFSSEVGESSVQQGLFGLPFSIFNFEYTFDENAKAYFPKFSGNALSLIFDILIGYLIAVLISFSYYKIKKTK